MSSDSSLGAPTKYDPKYCLAAEKAIMLGATDFELAEFLDVSTATLHNWRCKYPAFAACFNIGKEAADARVERSLYLRAMGYKFTTQKALVVNGEVKIVEVTEQLPPDTTSMIFWLKNRKPQVWRDMRQIEMGGPGSFEAMADDELERAILEKAAEIGVLPLKTPVLIEYDKSAEPPKKGKPKLVKSDE